MTQVAADTAGRLKWSRQLLLDLTLRNRLLHFQPGAPGFKDRDSRLYKYLPLAANINALWKRLVDDEETARIKARQDDSDDSDDSEAVATITSQGDVFAAVDDEHLQKRLQKINRERETLESSTGDSAFFLALGFLEWYEKSAEESQPRFAPLLLLHVRLVQKRPPGGGARTFDLEMDADEYSGNPCLREKLAIEHGLDLPSTNDIASPEKYLNEVERRIGSKPQWKVHKTAALGFFNFARYRLWLDLDEKQWPSGKAPVDHQIVRDLVDQTWRGNSQPLPGDGEIAEQQVDRDLPVVLDADSTQYAALMAAQRGQSLVVIGPPGSGKSQTIANLIAVATAEGKTILFVAQKLAALEVVQRRMEETGLSSFCLPLHSHHSKPVDVHRRLQAARDAREDHAKTRTEDSGTIPARIAHRLNKVAAALAHEPTARRTSTADLIQLACVRRADAKHAWGDRWDEELLDIEIEGCQVSDDWREAREQLIRDWEKLRAEAGTPWQEWRPFQLFSVSVPEIEKAIHKLQEAVARLDNHLGTIVPSLRGASIAQLGKIAKMAVNLPLPNSLVPTLLEYVWFADRDKLQQLHHLEKTLDDYQRQLQKAAFTLREPAKSDASHSATILSAVRCLGESFDPSLPLTAATKVLADMTLARDQAHDLVASVAIYPEGLRILGGGSDTLTWSIVDRLTGVPDCPELGSLRCSHLALGRHLAGEVVALKDTAALADRLDAARETMGRAAIVVPAFSEQAAQVRSAIQESAGAICSEGFGQLSIQQLSALASAATDFAARTDDILSLHASPHGAMLLGRTPSVASVQRLAAALGLLDPVALQPPQDAPPGIVDALALGTATTEDIAEWAAILREGRANAADARQVFRAIDTVAEGASDCRPSPDLQRFVTNWCEQGGGSVTVRGLQAFTKDAHDAAHAVEQAKPFKTFASKFDLPEPTTIADLSRLANAAALLSKMPDMPANGLLNRVASLAAIKRVLEAVARSDEIQTHLRDLGSAIAINDLPPKEEIASLRRRLRTHQGRSLRWFSRDYRSARAQILSFVTRPLPPEGEILSLLDQAEALQDKIAAFRGDPRYCTLLGSAFEGHRTDWSGVKPVLEWANKFFASVKERKLSLGQLADLRRQWRAALEQAQGVAKNVTAIASTLAQYLWYFGDSEIGTGNGCRLSSLHSEAMLAERRGAAVAKELESLGCGTDTTLQAVAAAMTLLSASDAAEAKLVQLQEIVRQPLPLVAPEVLISVVSWFDANRQRGITPAVLAWLAVDGQAAVQSLINAATTAGHWRAAADAFTQFSNIDHEHPSPTLPAFRETALRIAKACQFIRQSRGNDINGEHKVEDVLAVIEGLVDVDSLREASKEWDAILSSDTFRADTHVIRETTAWVKVIQGAGADRALLEWFLEAETTARLRWWLGLAQASRQFHETIVRLVQSGIVRIDEFANESPVSRWQAGWAERIARLASSLDVLTRATVAESATLHEIDAGATAMTHACQIAVQLAPWGTDLGLEPSSLGSRDVAAHRAWVADAAEHLPADLVAWVVDEQPNERYQAVTAFVELLRDVNERARLLIDAMEKYGEVTGLGPAEVKRLDVTVETLRSRTALLKEAIPRLLPWASYVRKRKEAASHGLSRLLEAADKAMPPVEDLVLAFRAAIAVKQAQGAWSLNADTLDIAGKDHEHWRNEFAKDDRTRLEQNRHRVATEIASQSNRIGQSVPGESTALMDNILSYEAQKRRKHLPIRKLVEKAGPGMQNLCRCWLMTPMAVAQFLPPGKLEFDLVIMDEASQLPPEDAWGAIARGRQLVVVGDPKQMPPSDFFANAVGDGDGEDDSNNQNPAPNGAQLESILDTASYCLPKSWLRWHYRSRHQSLIAPANQFSYDEKLILFPSAFDTHPEMGVRHTYVPNATATTGRVVNSKEAEAIVDRLVELALTEIAKSPQDRLSFGVVAMNVSQQECIQDLLDTRRVKDARVDRAIAALEAFPGEPFFVKNLENIQGDERDVIVISYTYGPHTPGGTPAQRFGPINHVGGERRFNVLITRAKWRMEVFSSLFSNQILVTDAKNPGVKDFRSFLEYAESGRLVDQGKGGGGHTDSPFEDHVMAVLKGAGYEVEPQVGVAGYFIDMAVRHPHERGRFALGIECDGATYHSSRAARDRDRLREQVLNERGWKLYRIWSTDWFTNYELAKGSLLAAVARACQQD